jgi:outer membrane protein OmpA-like peptidoglycan-associated protein
MERIRFRYLLLKPYSIKPFMSINRIRILSFLNTKVSILTLVLCAGIFTSTFGQIKAAKSEMEQYNYSKAIEILHQFIQKADPTTKGEATLLMADCYRLQNDMQDARAWYFRAIRLGRTEPLTFFYYAKALRACGDYEAAKAIFLKYDSLVPDDHRGKIYASFCDSAIVWDEKPYAFEVNNAKTLNSLTSDFGPTFYDDGVMFATDRIMTTEDEKKNGWKGNGFLKLVYSQPKQKDDFYGDYNPPKLVPELFSSGSNDGPAIFSKDGNEIFLTRTFKSPDKSKEESQEGPSYQLKVFTATKIGDKWSKLKPFFFNNNTYSVGYPALSPDGNSLYFVSDVDGGFGGTDLYVTSRSSGSWTTPINLGPVVNTFGNETFPFMADNGDLYFASDGHPGYGGLDIFVTRKVGDAWVIPQNLGKPINSSYDDFALSMYKNDSIGLFSANRPGGRGEDDIYTFRVVGPLPALATQPAIAAVTHPVIQPVTKPENTNEEVKEYKFPPAENVVPVPTLVTAENKPPVQIPVTNEIKSPVEEQKKEGNPELQVVPKEEPKPVENVVPVPTLVTAENKPPVTNPVTVKNKPPVEEQKKEVNPELQVVPKEETKQVENVVPVPTPVTAENKPPVQIPVTTENKPPVEEQKKEVTPELQVVPKEETKPVENVVPVPTPVTAENKPPVEEQKKEVNPELQVVPKEEPKPVENIVPVPTPVTAENKPPVTNPVTVENKPPVEEQKKEVNPELQVVPKEETKPAENVVPVPAPVTAENQPPVTNMITIPELTSTTKLMVSGCVKDAATKEGVPSATVFFLDESKGQVIVHKTNETGCFRSQLIAGTSYRIKAMQTGYASDCVPFFSDTAKTQTEAVISNDLLLDKIGTKYTYRVDNIYYDFDRYFIRPDAEPSLNKLVQIMSENPVTVELGSHADCRGSQAYNLILTEKRANSAFQYIVNKGISGSRISRKWFGKSQLVNNCNCAEGVHCTEAEHQLNRRTEFHISVASVTLNEAPVDLTGYHEGDTVALHLFPADFFTNCNHHMLGGPLADLLKSSTLISSEPNSNLLYTVQIGAFSYSTPHFKNLNDVMNCKGNDGILRCFVGKFSSREEANWFRDHLRSCEFKDAFVTVMDEKHNPSGSGQMAYLSQR